MHLLVELEDHEVFTKTLTFLVPFQVAKVRFDGLGRMAQLRHVLQHLSWMVRATKALHRILPEVHIYIAPGLELVLLAFSPGNG